MTTTTQFNRSYWNSSATPTTFGRLILDLHVDIVIVGGGIVGVTTARMLKDRGLTVAIVEAHKVGQQVTGKSTAKVTSQHGILYQTLEKDFDEAHARLYAEAQEQGVRTIRELVSRHSIDCGLESKPAYTYTLDQKHVADIEKEVAVTRRLGLPASLVHTTSLPFDIAAAIRYDDQAQFQPTDYVVGLARTIPGDGCYVFEDSRVIDWGPNQVTTDQGSISAKHVVMATHLPLGQVGGYYSKAFPNAEPVIVARIDRDIDGMYVNVEEPSHSIRTHRASNGALYAIVAGSTFKPGEPDEETQRFADIEQWLNRHFESGPVEYRWVNEDYSSMDGVPFVGWSSSVGKDYLIATGFAGWGISNGTAAAIMLSDLATGTDNPWLELFDAKRIKPVKGGPKFLKESAAIASHLVTGYLSHKPKSCDELGAGEAAIINIDGKNIAAFKDEDGKVHAVSAACPHMGCIVGWNNTDRTWDCPCHGSRFTLNGDVIHGPAVKSLEIADP